MVESERGAFAPLGANLTLTSKLFQSSMLLADIVTISIDEFGTGKEESKSNRFLTASSFLANIYYVKTEKNLIAFRRRLG